jgi:hypothetical protein
MINISFVDKLNLVVKLIEKIYFKREDDTQQNTDSEHRLYKYVY